MSIRVIRLGWLTLPLPTLPVVRVAARGAAKASWLESVMLTLMSPAAWRVGRMVNRSPAATLPLSSARVKPSITGGGESVRS